MRENKNNTRRNRLIALGALPTAIAIGLGALTLPAGAQSSPFGSSEGLFGLNISDYLQDDNAPERTPLRTDFPKIEGLPDGVSVERQEWLDDHRVALFIRSKAMPEKPIQVQVLLARDWFSNPEKTFPEVWALDGLRANEKENGWTLHTNIAQAYARRNVNVILPVGGEASFYTDWQGPAAGKNYKWETFLTEELPAVLHNGYRGNGKRAIVGLSMGGTAAINLAEHRPDLFDFVGSFSGYLDTTSFGMPAGIQGALQDAGDYDSNNMWGPQGTKRWIDNDPKLGIEALKGKTVYVSAGNGADDYGKPGSVATGPSNTAGIGLEMVSRMSTQTFIDRANRAGVDVIARLRPTGVHNWPYWQFEMGQAWPFIADALGVEKADQNSDCEPIGAIAEEVKAYENLTKQTVSCINNEYDQAGGKVEDFDGGRRVFWSPETGAHLLIGRINARYSEMGGPESWLGFPTTGELTTPDKVGRFVEFQKGYIYWTPDTGAQAIPRDMFEAWGKEGYETGILGYPISEPKEKDGVLIQQFQGGYVVRNKEAGAFVVKGEIAKRYTAINTIASKLGAPTSNEIPIPGGVLQNYDNGSFYWSPATGPHFIFNGDIRDEWGKRGWEQGELGWPTTDEEAIPAGGLTITFQHGTIKQINGVVHVDKK